jgi:catechol 2,3-dioxygenase-like lactoylglutathione lyase family enzyme
MSAIGIITEELSRSLSFYRQLGLDIPAGADKEPHVEVELPGGLRLLWDTLETVQSFDPDYRMPADGHRISLAFAFDSPAEVDDAYAKLTRDHRGYKEPWNAYWGQRYAIVLDPDGNAVDLFAALG